MVKEYIEKELAINEIIGEYPDAHYPSWYADIIRKIPVADVDEVIHCGNCKYFHAYKIMKDVVNNEWLKSWGKCTLINMDIDIRVDDFCSYGERKEQEDEN